MSDSATRGGNPYVGPEAYPVGHQFFFGRDRERRELASILRAERVVFLHAPSGAGKSSLINAGLIPALRGDFDILPVSRLGLPPSKPELNRYSDSAMQFFNNCEPAPEPSLRAFCQARASPDPDANPLLLIFDQFEEVLTIDPYDRAEKKAFFEDLGALLTVNQRPSQGNNRAIWALFSLREEYLAALDPYMRLLPPGLGRTFRLDLLDEKAAKEVVAKPAAACGIPFTSASPNGDAAEQLVTNLRRVRTYSRSTIVRTDTESGSSFTESDLAPEGKLSPYIEPVLLQIVCHRIWEDVSKTGAKEIPVDIASDVKRVDLAVQGFYERQVELVAEQLSAHPSNDDSDPGPTPGAWTIRRWIERCLIDENRNRTIVVDGSNEAHEIGHRAIGLLVDAHLLRRDIRSAGTLYELAHDRLITPILEFNRRWRRQNQAILSTRAEQWDLKHRPEDQYLLSESELEEARTWAAEHPDAVTLVDREFLRACEQYHKIRKAKKRANLFLKAIGFAVVFGAICAGFAGYAWRQKSRAETRGNILGWRASIAAAREKIPVNVDEALKDIQQPLQDVHTLAHSLQGDLSENASESERRGINIVNFAFQTDRAQRTLTNHTDEVNSLAVTAKGRLVASASSDMTVRIWDVATGQERLVLRVPAVSNSEGGKPTVNSVSLSPGGPSRIAVATSQMVAVAVLQDDGRSASNWQRLSDNPAEAVSFDRSGLRIASASEDGFVRLWILDADIAVNPNVRWQINPDPANKIPLRAIVFGDRWMAAAGDSNQIAILDPDQGELLKTFSEPSTSAIRGLAVSPDGSRLAAALGSGAATVWNVGAGVRERIVFASPDRVTGVSFSPDGRMLATSARDRLVKVWDIVPVFDQKRGPDAVVPIESRTPLLSLRGHSKIATSVAFHPAEPLLFSGSDDKTIKCWQLDRGPAYFAPLDLLTQGVRRVALSPGLSQFAVVWEKDDAEGIKIWNIKTGRPLLNTTVERATALALHPSGNWFVYGNSTGQLFLTTIQEGSTFREFKLANASPDETIMSLAFDAPGKRLAVCTGNNKTEAKSRVVVGPIGPEGSTGRWDEFIHPKIVFGATFDEKLNRLATACNDSTARIWDLNAPNAPPADILTDTLPEQGTYYEVAFSPNGDFVAAACADGIARVWNLKTKACTRYDGHEHGVRTVAFSHDGKRLATGSYDKTIMIWNLTGAGREVTKPLHTLIGFDYTVGIARFAAVDSDIVIAAGFDKTVRTFDLNFERLIGEIKKRNPK
jgi:WD40 repeat protein